jgi:hypothetical protein
MATISYGKVQTDTTLKGVEGWVYNRAEDAAIARMRAPYLYVDPADPYYSSVSLNNGSVHTGYDMLNSERWFWTKPDMEINQANAAFNNLPTFDFIGDYNYTTSTGSTDLDFQVPMLPMCRSYTIVTMASVTASVLSQMNATDGTSKYLFDGWDDIATEVVMSFQMLRSAGTRMWSFTPRAGVSGNGHSVSWTTYPGVVPVADTPFIVAIQFDYDTLTSKFYFNDGETPVSIKTDHSQAYDGADGRYWLGTVNMTNTTSGWIGSVGKFFVHDDTVTPMTTEMRTAMFNEWKAAAGI